MFKKYMDQTKPDALNRLVAVLASNAWLESEPDAWRQREVESFLNKLSKIRLDINSAKLLSVLISIFNDKTNKFFDDSAAFSIFTEQMKSRLDAHKKHKGGQNYFNNAFMFHLFLELKRAESIADQQLIGEALRNDGYICESVRKILLDFNVSEAKALDVFKIKFDIFEENWVRSRLQSLQSSAMSYVWQEYHIELQNSFCDIEPVDKEFFLKDFLEFCIENPLPLNLGPGQYFILSLSPYFESYDHIKRIATFKKSSGTLHRLDFGKEN